MPSNSNNTTALFLYFLTTFIVFQHQKVRPKISQLNQKSHTKQINKSSTPTALRAPTIPSHLVLLLVGHTGPILSRTFSSDGKYLLTAGHNRTVRLWNPTKRDPAFLSSNNKFSNNNSTTITSNTVPLHNIAPALPIQSYTNGHTYPVSSVAVDSSSTTLLSASDKALVTMDVVTRKLRRRFADHHTDRINAVACAEGAEAFLSGSYDRTVRAWDWASAPNGLGWRPNNHVCIILPFPNPVFF